MFKVSLQKAGSFVIAEPTGKVSKGNIAKACKTIQPWLADSAHSLLVVNELFEDWDGLAAVFAPLIEEEQRAAITSIAIVTDRPTGEFGHTIRTLYPQASVNIYCFCEHQAAITWLAPDMANNAA